MPATSATQLHHHFYYPSVITLLFFHSKSYTAFFPQGQLLKTGMRSDLFNSACFSAAVLCHRIRWLLLMMANHLMKYSFELNRKMPSKHLNNTYHLNTKLPRVLWHCWLSARKSICPIKIECWGVGVVNGYLSGAKCRFAHCPADATASWNTITFCVIQT